LAHPLLAFFLLVQQLALAAGIAAIAFGCDFLKALYVSVVFKKLMPILN
jgi:hypothetical protein